MKQQSGITELRFQQDCFLWHWNTRPHMRGRLFMVYNTPSADIIGTLLKGAGMVKGVSDLIYMLPFGKHVYIELKQGTQQSRFQKWFEEVAKKFGNDYYLIITVEEFKSLIISYEENEKASGIVYNLPVYPV